MSRDFLSNRPARLRSHAGVRRSSTFVGFLGSLFRYGITRRNRMSAVPPRFAYWTILIDNTATAFRAQHAEDLLPTLVQLRRTNSNVVMKWFARGRLWESPDEAKAAVRAPKLTEKRGRDWRPGGQHK